MKKLVIIAAMILPLATMAQNEVDALRYSQNYFSGTARFNAMGGSLGALGGDFSVLSLNPAGLGVYRSSEFTFTPGFQYNNSSASYMGGTLDDYKFKMNIGNVGFIANHTNDSDEGWVSTSFAVGYNRVNDFNRYIKIEGENDVNSMTNYFAAMADGNNTDNLNYFSEGLAWDAYLLDPDAANPAGYHYVPAFQNRGLVQRKDINTKGGMGEYLFALGGNYNNQLYIGGSMGIQSVRYSEHTEYSEVDVNDSIPDFNWFEYKTDLRTTGAGVNFKFGMVFRPADWVRIGGAVHTPTFLSLHDEYSSTMQSNFNSPDSVRGDGKIIESPMGSYDYQLTTPFRAIGSLGFVIAKMALISVDYEYVDYTAARLRADDYSFREENNTIETAYNSTGNLRAGAEFRTGPFSFRAGYAMYGSPYRSGQANASAVRTGFTGGFGMRDDDFFFDISGTYMTTDEKYYLWDPSVVALPEADMKYSSVSLLATFGFKF